MFADTSGFLAMIDKDDPNHESAVQTWTGLVADGTAIYSTNYVIIETVSLLHHRFGIRAVQRFADDILPVIRMIWVDPQLHSVALNAVLSGSRRGPGVVDCVSFESMRSRNLQSALAFDRHFTERGYELPETRSESGNA